MNAIALARTLSGVMLALTLAVAATFAQNPPQCVVSGSPPAGWGFNSIAYIMIASGEIAVNVSGEILSSSVSQNPQHGTLQQLDTSLYVHVAGWI
jgi:hypothetical protein